MATPYLVTNPPRIRQFRPRRDTPSGLIVVHTAESKPDETGPDTGTDGVAAFIRDRTTYGSYHVLADSDSRLQLVAFDQAAYGDGTGSNDFAIHISLATQAADWARLPKAWRDGAIRQLAGAAADAARWLQSTHGVTVPVARVSRMESDRRRAGFISHAERDPGRRSDPGAGFPWAQFLAEFEATMHPAPPKPSRPGRPDAVAERRHLTRLARKLTPGRLREKVRAARDLLPKPRR